MTDCDLLRIEKKAMMGVLHREHALSDMFVAYLLTRNIRYEEDLVDQLFVPSPAPPHLDYAILLYPSRRENRQGPVPRNACRLLLYGKLSQCQFTAKS